MKFITLAATTLIALSTVAAETTVDVSVTEKGFEPSKIEVSTENPVTLKITRKTDNTCSTSVQVPSQKIKLTELPLNKTVEIKLGKLAKGEIKFGCGMNMMDSAKIYVK